MTVPPIYPVNREAAMWRRESEHWQEMFAEACDKIDVLVRERDENGYAVLAAQAEIRRLQAEIVHIKSMER